MATSRRLPALVAIGCLAVLAAGAATRAHGDTRPPPVACTLIACGPGVYVKVERLPAQVLSARVCVAGRCGTAQRLTRGSGALGFVQARLPKRKRRAGASVKVTLVLLDRDGRVLSRSRIRAHVRRLRPNGPECPPTCFQAALRYRGDSGRLVPLPRAPIATGA